MSEHAEHAEHPAIRAEPDHVPTPRIVAVGVLALILFLVASVVTIRWGLDGTRAALLPDGPPAPPAEIGKNKIGIVEQRLFEVATEPAEVRRGQAERLRSWGWVDRKAGVVHMPIDEAMARVARGERP
jgi:hypothetical protein